MAVAKKGMPQMKTITINGRVIPVHPDMPVADIKALAGLGSDRVLVTKHPDGGLQIVPNHQPLPGSQALSAPRFIYG
jgi:hypothetical protein